MVDGPFYSLNCFNLIKRPQAIPNGPNECGLRGVYLTRLDPALKGHLMYSNFFCCFFCRILAINQGYTYSNIVGLSRKISAMSIAGFPQSKGGAVYNYIMAKNVVHISEAEAASDFAALMARVRAGAEVIIESGKRPVAVLHAAEPVRRTISECIALAKAHEEETGKAPVLDPDFAEDVDEILNHRKPWNPPAWE